MSKLVSQRTATTQSYEEHKLNLKRPIGLPGTTTGFYDLDMIFGGWRPRKVATIAARSGIGKTSYITQMARGAAKIIDGRRSELCIASWEQAAQELVTRFVSHHTGFTIDQLQHPYLFTEAQNKMVTLAYQEAVKLPVHYHQFSTDIEEVLKFLDEFIKMVRGKETLEGIKIQPVFILDYIGMAKGRTKYGSRTYDVGDFLQELKSYCNTSGLASLILAQISRTADIKDRPEVMDISDSSFIEQNSDIIILGERPEKRRKETIKDPETDQELPSKGKILWMAEKNRGGRTGHYLGNCDVAYNRYWNRDHTWNYDYTELYKSEDFWLNQFR